MAGTQNLVRSYRMDKPIYEFIDLPFGTKALQRTDPDGKVWSIPQDPANSDYQAYLNKDNPKEVPNV